MEEKMKKCVNCSEYGHIIKNCLGPIISYGLIVFKVVNKIEDEKNDYPEEIAKELKKMNVYMPPIYPKIKILMIQRKDTMSYIDFIRGKYPLNNPEKEEILNVYFSEMTKVERETLKTKTFDELWESLWLNKNSRLYKNEKKPAKERYNQIDISKYLEITESNWEIQELGFPKGRPNMSEKHILCAEREFNEETNYDKCMIQYIERYPIIEEKFLATNNIVYNHKYYLAKLKDEYVDYIPKFSSIQEGEVKSVGWYSIKECLFLIRDYDKEKKKMIQKVYENIKNMNFTYSLKE